MLKTTKIIVISLGITSVAGGSYFLYDRYFSAEKKVPEKKKTQKFYDTIPERDSSLDKLNRILADNKEAAEKIDFKNPVEVETYENIDKNSRLYDSLVKAGSVKDVNQEITVSKFNEPTVIRSDKFLTKKQYSILNYSGSGNSTDSLMSNLAEIKFTNPGKITVEFWESPVDYKGYRLGREKMVVFGLIPQGVNLVRHQSDLYIVTLNNIYLVKPCSDFCNLKPIKDKALAAEVMRHVN